MKPVTLENFLPVGDFVLVEVVHEAPVTPGGLYRPMFDKFLRHEGVVRVVGKECPATLQPGDRVLLPRYEGMRKVTFEDVSETRRFILIAYNEILGVVYE